MKALLLVASMVAVTLVASPAAFGGPPPTNCLDHLNGHSYLCQSKISGLQDSFTVSLTFADGALGIGAPPTAACSCAPGGTFNVPKFNFSQTKWTCVALDNAGTEPQGFVIQGNVTKAGKLSKVTAADNAGQSYVFDCDPSEPVIYD